MFTYVPSDVISWEVPPEPLGPGWLSGCLLPVCVGQAIGLSPGGSLVGRMGAITEPAPGVHCQVWLSRFIEDPQETEPCFLPGASSEASDTWLVISEP